MEKDQLEIILEDIRDKFDLVLEGHEGLRKEIKDTRQELNEKISLVDFKVEALNQKLGNVDDSLNQKIDSVEGRLNQKIDTVEDRLNQKIDGVEGRLNQKIDTVEGRLNQKIDTVESRLTEKIDAITNDLADHRRDTEAHSTIYKVKEEQ